MKATKNNYDQSSTGHDIELTVMLDGDMARIEWDDNFIELPGQSRAYGSTGRYWYTDCGQLEAPGGVADCIDWTLATADNCRSWLVERYCTGEYGESVEWLDEGARLAYEGADCIDWIELARDTINGGNAFSYDEGVSIQDAVGNDFAELGGYFTVKYSVAKIKGHCQGDYAEVLYDPAIWTGEFDPSNYFENLFYDAPVFARVEVNGHEYYIDERMADPYRWDKLEAEKIVRGLELPDSVKDWIIGELPQYPKYVG